MCVIIIITNHIGVRHVVVILNRQSRQYRQGMAGVNEETLIKIAEKIVDTLKFRLLAEYLHITPESAERFRKTNLMFGQVSSEGTLDMLHEWKADTIVSEQRSQLKQALVHAGYKEIAEKHFGPLNEGDLGRKRSAETQHQVMEGVRESTLLSIAKKIVNETKFLALADELNWITPESATSYWRMNMMNMMFGERSAKGTLAMFHDWKEGTIMAEQISQLKQALVNAGYEEIAEEHFGPLNEGKSGRKRSAKTKHQVEEPAAKKTGERQHVPETAVKPEDEVDGSVEVRPDGKGSYKGHTIKVAKPTKKQLDKKHNYFMARYKKGMVFIMNNFCEDRTGSLIDVKNIRHVFEEIGYDSVIERDLESTEIMERLDNLIKNKIREDHTSVVLVLMSHGDETGICGTDQRIVKLQDIKEKFYATNCPALEAKPKIIFVQACRGGKITPYVRTDDEPSSSGVSSAEKDNPRTSRMEPITAAPSLKPTIIGARTVGKVHLDYRMTPDNADIYIANATSEGYYACRTEDGSWFIQALCEELIRTAHEQDLDFIMNEVSRRVMSIMGEVELKDTTTQSTSQTPAITKQGIRKKIFLLPKYPANEEA